ncbi:MAG: pyridoxal phosphate-dependent aminotransferase [Spirochaetales bacterium]|nr:pyridoxal phosphate-dependent aminotransferase [Spirochaetales bacterium]
MSGKVTSFEKPIEVPSSVEILKSSKLNEVCYDIRGPVMQEAKRMEEEGFRVLKLNIGNPALFGFDTPDELLHDVIRNLRNAQGYADSQGVYAARKAVMQYYQTKGLFGVEIDDIYMGNGVSELIVMAMQGLLNSGDEILVPAPDYPLWTAAVTLGGGKPVHYRCDEKSEWFPDIEDIQKKVSHRTRGIVVINPNNPTGAVYSREILEKIAILAHEHRLIVFSDEIYDKILYDDAQHLAMGTLVHDSVCITFNGLSKSYRAAGFRSGWMVISGRKNLATNYREGLNMLANMRLCANVPAQFAVQAALGGYQSINDLVLPGGRLREQRDAAWEGITSIPGISCVKPKGALYLFPRLDPKKFKIKNDMQMVLDLLKEKKILVVQGTGFNWLDPHHFRIVFLPDKETLKDANQRLGDFFSLYHQ